MDYANHFTKGDDVADVKAFGAKLSAALRELDHEVLLGIYIDEDNRLVDLIQEGTGDATSVGAPHEQFVTSAKRLGVKKFLIAHNHPGENKIPCPSGITIFGPIPEGDVGFTLGLLQEIKGKELTLIDHLVVGRNYVTSLQRVLGVFPLTRSHELNCFSGRCEMTSGDWVQTAIAGALLTPHPYHFVVLAGKWILAHLVVVGAAMLRRLW